MSKPRTSEPVKVSVILPVWNPGRAIGRCLCSLRKQTLRNIEMIFVDDRGTDDAMEIVRAAAAEDPRVRILVNPENLGAGGSRNAGIGAARGDYLLFADPDDYLDPDYLEELYREAVSKGLDIVKGRLSFEDPVGNPAGGSDLNAKIKKKLAAGYPLYAVLTSEHTSLMMRRGMPGEPGVFYGPGSSGEDSLFLLRLGLSGASFGICETLGTYHYVRRDGSGMNRFDGIRLGESLAVFKEQTDILLEGNFDRYAEQYVWERIRFLLLMHDRVSRDPAMAEEAAAFLSGLREQLVRLPLDERTVRLRLLFLGLLRYGENFTLTPPAGFSPETGDGGRAFPGIRPAGFLAAHPREIPVVTSALIRTIIDRIFQKY